MNFADLGVSEQNKFCFYRLRQQLLFELQYLYVYMPVCCTLLFVLQEKLMLTTSHPYTQPFPTETAVPTAAVPRGVTAVARGLLSGWASPQGVPDNFHVPSSGV